MDAEKERLGLLECLSLRAGCMYLSDLPRPEYRLCIQHTLRGLPPERFSLREWNDAAEYIAQRECSFETGEQARRFLLDITSCGRGR